MLLEFVLIGLRMHSEYILNILGYILRILRTLSGGQLSGA